MRHAKSLSSWCLIRILIKCHVIFFNQNHVSFSFESTVMLILLRKARGTLREISFSLLKFYTISDFESVIREKMWIKSSNTRRRLSVLIRLAFKNPLESSIKSVCVTIKEKEEENEEENCLMEFLSLEKRFSLNLFYFSSKSKTKSSHRRNLIKWIKYSSEIMW